MFRWAAIFLGLLLALSAACAGGSGPAPAPASEATAPPTSEATAMPTRLPATATPTPTPTAAPTATPEPRAASLEVLSSITRPDTIGNLYIEGEVRNNSGRACDFVKLVAVLYDAAGSLLATGFSYTDLDEVPPGGTSPFRVLVLNAPPFDHYTLQPQGQVAGDISKSC